MKKFWRRNKKAYKEKEVEDFNEVEVELMDKVEDLIIHVMRKENQNGKKIILFEEEVNT